MNDITEITSSPVLGTIAAPTPTQVDCFGVEEFSKPDAATVYITPLPRLPDIKSYYEASDFKSGPSNYMTVAEEQQRFMEYNYAKFAGLASRVTHLQDYIVLRNMPMMYAMTSRYSKQLQIDWDDALSECQVKFLEAVDGFNPTLGLKFSTYVCRIIRNTLVAMRQRGAESQERKVTWQARKNARTENVTGLSTMIQDEELPVQELRKGLIENKAGLSRRERIVLIHHYGLTGQKKKRLNEIGEQLGWSREYIRLIEGTAIEKLRAWFDRDTTVIQPKAA